ncbi:MAG TPA: ABC transporter substrate-binding protein, partial [Negativicutes bacterium]|nr:ABC transporter substrate-binding protein [Negativicutes bacterium]
MRRYGIIIALGAAMLWGMLAAAGCAGGQVSNVGGSAGAAAYQVTDTQGNVLTLPRKPERIVTLSLSSDEMVLGMTQPERVVALHYLAYDPGISTIADKAGRVPVKMRDYNAEMLVALRADLVIVPDWTQAELTRTLRDLGLPVFVSKGPSSVAEIKQAIREISQAIGEEETGRRILEQMDGELDAIA